MASVRLLRRVSLAELRSRLRRNAKNEAFCGVAGGGWLTTRRASGRQAPHSSVAAGSDSGHVVRSPYQSLALPHDVSLMEHLFDDFGRYGQLTALVSVPMCTCARARVRLRVCVRACVRL